MLNGNLNSAVHAVCVVPVKVMFQIEGTLTTCVSTQPVPWKCSQNPCIRVPVVNMDLTPAGPLPVNKTSQSCADRHPMVWEDQPKHTPLLEGVCDHHAPPTLWISFSNSSFYSNPQSWPDLHLHSLAPPTSSLTCKVPFTLMPHSMCLELIACQVQWVSNLQP